MQAMPVQTQVVALAPVAQSSDYVATIKSRRSVTLMPQVDGNLTVITVKSGDRVRAGQVLMTVDPAKQKATVDAQQATEKQKKALYDYNTIAIERQRKLFADGVISRDALDQAEQLYQNTRADWQSAIASRQSLEEQLAYYTIRAPFDGVVGDIPVHLGDYVTTATALTTVDENKDLEAYIYIPTARSVQARIGLPVQLLDGDGKVIETTAIDFLSPQVDSQLQSILAKAPVSSEDARLRSAQMIEARVIWKTAPMPTIPILSVVRQGGQSFVFVLDTSGGHPSARQVSIAVDQTIGNDYAVSSGVKPGDRIITSRTQFLADHMPVIPIG
uniref:Secretion protein HlyD n=1 Tax=mine drainage metagenome TaxID=410659 RepID=E6PX76_9ZZZZ